MAEHRVVLDERQAADRGRAAHPARQPPADRGIHDPRQCRGGRGAGSAAAGLHVPGARCAGPGKARRVARFPRRDRHSRAGAGQGSGRSGRSCSTASWRAPPRRRSAKSSTSWSCAARRRPCTARTISAISGSRCRATRISPRRSGAMPICSCIGRWSRAARRRARPATDFGAIAEHISATERRAAAAERSALDRYRASLLGGAIGTVFEARITGVASFGLFVTLPETGADGLIPISTLPSDYYDHDSARHRLVGRRTGRVFALGDAVSAILVEADAIGGRMVFRLDDHSASRTAARSPADRGRPRRELSAPALSGAAVPIPKRRSYNIDRHVIAAANAACLKFYQGLPKRSADRNAGGSSGDSNAAVAPMWPRIAVWAASLPSDPGRRPPAAPRSSSPSSAAAAPSRAPASRCGRRPAHTRKSSTISARIISSRYRSAASR